VFAYNNNIYLDIKRAFYKLLINYIVDFANALISKFLTRETLLVTKRIKIIAKY